MAAQSQLIVPLTICRVACLAFLEICVKMYNLCLFEGCGGQHSAAEGARSGCSGVGEESQQQSNLRPRSRLLPLQVQVLHFYIVRV